MIKHRPYLYLTKKNTEEDFHLHVSVALQANEGIQIIGPDISGTVRYYYLVLDNNVEGPARVWNHEFVFPDPVCPIPNPGDCEDEVHVIVTFDANDATQRKGTGKTLHSNADDKPFGSSLGELFGDQ